MGCNCGKKRPHGPKPRPTSFTLVTRSGARIEFARRLDAEAARARAGGGTITER